MIKYLIEISIFLYLILLIILIINIKKKNFIIKCSYILIMLMLIGMILYFNEMLIDEFLEIIIRYLLYPKYISYVFSVIISIIILINSIISNKLSSVKKIFNYFFSIIIILSYIIFTSLDIDVYSNVALYSNKSLILLRIVSFSMLIYALLYIVNKYYSFFIKKR